VVEEPERGPVVECPACGQVTPTLKLGGVLYFANHVEVRADDPYWTDDSAPLVIETRMCEMSGRQVDQQT
jgi:hypothetical protein